MSILRGGVMIKKTGKQAGAELCQAQTKLQFSNSLAGAAYSTSCGWGWKLGLATAKNLLAQVGCVFLEVGWVKCKIKLN